MKKASARERKRNYDPEKRRWRRLPAIGPCWRGNYRRPQPRGRHYQEQLYCGYWEGYINPSGHTCAECEARRWPEAERMRHHTLPALIERDEQRAREALVEAVHERRLTYDEAAELADEFFPEG